MAMSATERTASWCKANPERAQANALRHRQTERYKRNLRNRLYKRAYGITLEEFEQMVEAQNNLCAICKQPETSLHINGDGTIRRLSVDHCHTTGAVRKLLCNSCNTLLGRAKDSTELLEACITYLKEHKT